MPTELMHTLKQSFLQKAKSDRVDFEMGQPLNGEFYIDFAHPADTYISADILVHLGYHGGRFDHSDWRVLIHPDDRNHFDEGVARLNEDQHAQFNSMIRLQAKNGSWQSVLQKSKLIRKSSDTATSIASGILVPIDEDAMRNVAPAPPTYDRSILDAFPDMAFIVNKDGVYVDFSAGKLAQMYFTGDFIGKAVHDIMPDPIAKEVHRAIYKLHMGQAAEPFEYSLEVRGEELHYRCHMSQLTSELFMAVAQDISEVKRSQLLFKELFEHRRIFVEQAPNALAMIDKDLRYLALSNKWCVAYGLDASEVVGTGVLDTLPGDRNKWREHLNEASRGRTVHCDEECLEAPDGSRLWLKWELRPWLLRGDEVGGVLIHTENITEKKRITAENERISGLQELLMNISAHFINLPIADLDPAINETLHVLSRNVEADRIYVFSYDWEKGTATNTHEWCSEGVTPQIDELQGLDIHLNPGWADAHRAGREVFIEEVEALEPGVVRNMLMGQDIKSLLTIPLTNGESCIGFVGFDYVHSAYSGNARERELLRLFADMLVNVKLRIKAQEEIDATKSKVESILTEMTEVVWSLELPDYNTAFLSPAVETLTGKPADQCSSSAYWWEEFIHPGDTHITEGFIQSLENEGYYSGEHRIITALGELKWVYSRGREITDDQGEVIRVDAMISDITQRKLDEERIQHLLQVSNDQNDRLKNFAHIVAHNLRSHSSNFQALLELWKEAGDEDQKRLFYDNILQASSHLNSTIDQLNEVVQLTSAAESALKPVDLSESFNRSLGAIQHHVRQSGAEIVLNTSAEMAVHAIPAYLESVFHNLVTNAIKYRSPERSPLVRIDAQCEGKHCVVRVSDNGLGIDLERHGSKVFGFQKTFHGNSDAQGIGLFITRNQVQAMGGKIEVESKPNEGTTFTIWLQSAGQ